MPEERFSADLKIVHISDIHVAEPHFLPDLMERVIERVEELQPEIVVLTGDLTESGYSFEFERAKKYVERLKCERLVVVPGNHDARNVGYLCFEDFFGARFKVLRHEGVTVVAVDSTQPDLDEGHVGREKYEWIQKSFEEAGEDLKIFALHHHLLPVPYTGRERNVLTDAGDVLKLLCDCGVQIALCGHKHVSWVWSLNEMVVLNAGTACTNRVKYRILPSFNLIELEEAHSSASEKFPHRFKRMRVKRIYSKGGEITVLERELF